MNRRSETGGFEERIEPATEGPELKNVAAHQEIGLKVIDNGPGNLLQAEWGVVVEPEGAAGVGDAGDAGFGVAEAKLG